MSQTQSLTEMIDQTMEVQALQYKIQKRLAKEKIQNLGLVGELWKDVR